MKKWLPLIITLIFAGWFAGKLRVPRSGGGDWAVGDFGKIPVVVDGRHMPMDTMARTVLTLLRNKQDANYEPWKSFWEKQRIVTATEWALEVMVQPEVGDTRPVIRIDNPDVKGLFDLPQDADASKQTDGKHFSWAQLQPKWSEFISEVRRASAKESDKTPYEKALVRLASGAQAYRKMKLTFGPASDGDLTKGLTEYQSRIVAWREAFKANLQGQESDQEAYGWGEEQRTSAALIAPRKGAEKSEDSKWASAFEEALSLERGEPAPTLAGYADMAKAFRTGDHEGFAAAVRSHLDGIAAKEGFAADLKKASREQLLSYAAPFYNGMAIAVFAALMAIASWFSPARLDWLRRSAVRLMLLVLAMHIGGIIARCIIEGHPPVTSLYTASIFIGGTAVVFGLALEWIYPYAIGVVVAAALEFGALFVAHNLMVQDGTPFKVLEAVLNTNFWLATHVILITLGNMATLVAGFLAIIYIVRAVFGNLTPDLAKAVTRMVYAIVCFATLFSFVGTVLGGLWADQSWGRFWGWDVKENGAVMIVLWNAIFLHARWGGLFRERGLMCCAVFGNVVTVWSLFGVNTLGIGLHTYGATSGVKIAVITFDVIMLALIVSAWCFCGPSVKDKKAKAELEPQAA